MSGLRLNLPISFTDATLPILRNDPMLAAGSLALYEFGHPMSAVVDVPASGVSLYNVAGTEATALTGASASSLAALWETAGLTGTKGKVERSGKGGMHAIVSGSGVVSGEYAGLEFPVPVIQYILSNPTHVYFASYWGRTTRKATDVNASFASYMAISAAAAGSPTDNLFVASRSATNYPTDARRLGYSRNPSNSGHYTGDTGYAALALPVPVRTNIAVNGHGPNIVKTADQVFAARFAKAFGAGRRSEIYGSGATAGNSSEIHYRTYLEDLTVSGRTYAQADAVDSAEYTKHVLTVGGRYYGDTYTDPTTIP